MISFYSPKKHFNKMTYPEALKHIKLIRKYIRLSAIANEIGLSPSMLDNIVNEREINGKVRTLAERFHPKFIEIVEGLAYKKEAE